MFYLSKTPTIIQRLFNNYIWRFPITDRKVIYLTFDDGPTPEITEWTLQELKKFNAKATFFCIGKNIENHPEIFQKIIENGHSIGNHTHNHLNGWKTDNVSYFENIEKANKSIQSAISNFQSKVEKKKSNNLEIRTQNSELLFRPPYGKIKPRQATELIKKGVKIILWDILSGDFDTDLSREKSLENCIKHSKNGSIIVFHDSVKAADKLKYILPQVLAHFKDKGFVFEKIR
jgi:peptidoglycan/xylan/chitin deacetylase (PgdA/CDA1 family)